MHCELIFMHRESIHASLVNIHALRVNSCIARRSHTSQKIHVSREDLIPRRKFMHREKISYLTEMYASKEDFIPCGINALREDIHALQKIMHRGQFMHRESIHASRVNIHATLINIHASRVNIHASREDFIPRRNVCIARRFHTLRNLCIAGRYSCPAEDHASRVNSCITS